VPQIARAVRIPVIAAGGVADAKGVAAAMALGAAGVQVGTSYLLCPECSTSPLHRTALKSDSARQTALTNVFTGRPARAIVNRIIRELGPVSAAAPMFPLAFGAILPLASRAAKDGNPDFVPMWAGQNVSGCRELPAAQITRALVNRADRDRGI
jgi:nitronate monooxygenase